MVSPSRRALRSSSIYEPIYEPTYLPSNHRYLSPFERGNPRRLRGDESERDDESTYGRLSTKSFFLLRRCSQPANIVSTPNPSRRSGSIAPCSCCAISTTT